MNTRYKVYDLMTTKPATIGEKETINTAAKKMSEQKVGSLVVVKDDKLKGLITEKDIVIKIVATNAKPEDFIVKQIMTPEKELLTIEPEKDVYSAMILMKDNNVRRLPVVENEKLQGIITMKDILKIEPDLFDHITDTFILREEERKIN
ncbi:MAG: cyclic nucleotide-binding/CBS domain-containing protein [Candidatus Woesearchaeota archaeon]